MRNHLLIGLLVLSCAGIFLPAVAEGGEGDALRTRLLSQKRGRLTNQPRSSRPEKFALTINVPTLTTYHVAFQSREQFRIQLMVGQSIPILTVVGDTFYLLQYPKKRFLFGNFSHIMFQFRLAYRRQQKKYQISVGFSQKPTERDTFMILDFDSFLRREYEVVRSKTMSEQRQVLHCLTSPFEREGKEVRREARFLIDQSQAFPYQEMTLGFSSPDKERSDFKPFVVANDINLDPRFHPKMFSFPREELEKKEYSFLRLQMREDLSARRKAQSILRQIRSQLKQAQNIAKAPEKLQKAQKKLGDILGMKAIQTKSLIKNSQSE